MELTQPHFAHRALLRAGFAGLLLLHDALDFGLRLAALGGFGFGVGLVCAALLGGLDLFGRSVVRLRSCAVCGLDLVGEWFFCKCVGGEARTIVTVAGAVVGCCDVVEEQEGFLFRKAIGVVGEDLNGLFL